MPEHPNFYAIREDSIMIFYFTGTGNSLYAANKLESDCRSIPGLWRSGRPLDFSAGRIGIVAPIYGHELPGMVKDFFENGPV